MEAVDVVGVAVVGEVAFCGVVLGVGGVGLVVLRVLGVGGLQRLNGYVWVLVLVLIVEAWGLDVRVLHGWILHVLVLGVWVLHVCVLHTRVLLMGLTLIGLCLGGLSPDEILLLHVGDVVVGFGLIS